MKNIYKINKGITLIALIVTIIVLLILAAVILNMVIGDSSVIRKANIAKENTNYSVAYEEIKTKVLEAQAKKEGKAKLSDIVEQLKNDPQYEYIINKSSKIANLSNKGQINNLQDMDDNNIEEIYVIHKGYEFKIDKTLKIEGNEKELGNTDNAGDNTDPIKPEVVDPTDIYVTLYTDGTLGFSNNEDTIEGKTVKKLYGNIRNIEYGQYEPNRTPWFESGATKVIINNKIVPSTTSCWFYRLYNVASIEGIENLDTSLTTNMFSMFGEASGLSKIDVSNFDTSNVVNMSYMFDACRAEELDVKEFNTSNVVNMSNMFSRCNVRKLNLQGFDTSNVTDMSGMFRSMSFLQELNLSSFNTENVVNMKNMFSGSNLIALDLTDFNTSNVTDMSYMFNYMGSLQELNLSSFNTENCTNMENMFENCKELKKIYISNTWKEKGTKEEVYGNCSAILELKQ